MRPKLSAVLFVAVVSGPSASVAQARALDSQYPAPCNLPDMAMVTIGNCMDLEYAFADSALNAAYHLAQRRLSPSQFQSLRGEQRQWLARRNAIRPSNAGNHPSMTVLPELISMTRGRVFEIRHRALSADPEPSNPIPAQATFRIASAGRGYVLQIRNQDSSPLALWARFYDPWSDELKSQQFLIPVGQTKEFGWAEGWRFESGHIVQLLHGTFASRLLVTP